MRDDLRADVASRWEVCVDLLFLGANGIGPEFDPAELTALIGLVPAKQWRVGDPNQLGAARRTCGWGLTSTVSPTAPLRAHIGSLLAALSGHEPEFSEAANRYRVQLECVVAADSESVSPELVVELDQLRALTSLSIAAVGLDIHPK